VRTRFRIEQDDAAGMVYVDLLENPERHTGYEGASPQRIWRAIYEENCFEEAGQCLEKRVFYRLMSGLQSSITTHIAADFFYGSTRGGYGEGFWAPNTPLFVDRVGKHPERLHNLYFAYVFVLRALSKAAHELETFDYATGHPAEDARAAALVRALVRPDHPLVAAASDAATCQMGFDETRLFVPASDDHDWSPPAQAAAAAAGGWASFEDLLATGSLAAGGSPQAAALDAAQEATALRSEFQARFRNISRIMDCVGCERCRLWGKLQVLGVGTALKVKGGGWGLLSLVSRLLVK
jgi:ERO1-like protein alpha